jgi:antitoxin MazE
MTICHYSGRSILQVSTGIEIHVAGARTFEAKRRPEGRQLLAQLSKFRGRLPADFKFDRLEANERG